MRRPAMSSWIWSAPSIGRSASNGLRTVLLRPCGVPSLSTRRTVAYGAANHLLSNRREEATCGRQGPGDHGPPSCCHPMTCVACVPPEQRKTLSFASARCVRGEAETLLHRFWTCPKNCDAAHPDIAGAQHLIPDVVAGCGSNAAFWLGCLITGGMLNPKVGRVPVKDCITTICWRFAEILKLIGRCGVDGFGGTNSSQPRCRSVGAGCGAQIPRTEKIEGSWIEECPWAADRAASRIMDGPHGTNGVGWDLRSHHRYRRFVHG